MSDLDEFPVVTEKAESYLNERQLLDYRAERGRFHTTERGDVKFTASFGSRIRVSRRIGRHTGRVRERCLRPLGLKASDPSERARLQYRRGSTA